MEYSHYERLFNIKTTGEQQGFYESHHYNRYEATSYFALETLFKEYPLSSNLWTERESNPHGETIEFRVCLHCTFIPCSANRPVRQMPTIQKSYLM